MTSLQKALWEQGEPLSWEVRRTSLCPCLGAAPGTGPWALPLWCCLYPAPQGAASVSPSHLTSYLGQDSFFQSIFCSKCQEMKEKVCSAWNFWKWEKKMQWKKNLGAVCVRWFNLLSVSERDSHKHCSVLVILLRTLIFFYMCCVLHHSGLRYRHFPLSDNNSVS